MPLQSIVPRNDPNSGNLKRALLWPAYALFFVMIVLPVTAKVAMNLLLLVVLFLIVLKLTLPRSKPWIHPTLWVWTWWYLILGVGYIALGFFYGAPGAMFSSIVYVLSPVVYVLLL